MWLNIFINSSKRISCRTKSLLSKKSNLNFNMKTLFKKFGTDASPEISKTIPQLKGELRTSMGVQSGYRPLPKPRTDLVKYLPKSVDELPKRTMSDSFIAAVIPLSSDENLQDKYITFLGHIRIGRLLEDMDIFAVMVARKHIHLPQLEGKGDIFPYTLVTVLVDKIDFTEYIPKPNEDIRISGHVSWVGRSSIEIVVWLEQKSEGQWRRLTRALFLMAARDPTNSKAAVVNALEPASEREKKILAGGEVRKKRRFEMQKQLLTKVVPTEEEQKVIHDLYMRTVNLDEVSLKNRKLPTNGRWMSDCILSNMIFTQPEDRNLHNTVFGGFIMRQATELSWSMGYLFSKHRPKLKSISDISFNKPIVVNSLLQMEAHVVYSQMQFFEITVYAQVRDPISGISSTTNTFHFTYEVPDMVPEVFPDSYHDAMMYIDGRRHFMNVLVKEVTNDVFLKNKL